MSLLGRANSYGLTSLNEGSAAILGDVHNSGTTIIHYATIVQQNGSLLEEQIKRTLALEKEVADIRRLLSSHQAEIDVKLGEAGALSRQERWEDVLIRSLVKLLEKTKQLLEFQKRVFVYMKRNYERDAAATKELLNQYDRARNLGQGNPADVRSTSFQQVCEMIEESEVQVQNAISDARTQESSLADLPTDEDDTTLLNTRLSSALLQLESLRAEAAITGNKRSWFSTATTLFNKVLFG